MTRSYRTGLPVQPQPRRPRTAQLYRIRRLRRIPLHFLILIPLSIPTVSGTARVTIMRNNELPGQTTVGNSVAIKRRTFAVYTINRIYEPLCPAPLLIYVQYHNRENVCALLYWADIVRRSNRRAPVIQACSLRKITKNEGLEVWLTGS